MKSNFLILKNPQRLFAIISCSILANMGIARPIVDLSPHPFFPVTTGAVCSDPLESRTNLEPSCSFNDRKEKGLGHEAESPQDLRPAIQNMPDLLEKRWMASFKRKT